MPPRFLQKVATVPKGFLRFYILKLLNEGSKSGSEIVQEIDNQTEGLWKPSPGSIYPLLSRLNDKAYIQEIERDGSGLKRYILTEKGELLLDEMANNRGEMRKFEASMLPLFIGSFEPGAHPKEIIELNRSVGNLLTGYWDLLDALRERYSHDIVEEAITAVDQAVRSMDELVGKFDTK
ncbi:MAG: PadR family transcriptional regulator [Thermoplasmata archaeon]|nr:PadR family transcriptional regulator [Thermoplasmata archaeon]